MLGGFKTAAPVIVRLKCSLETVHISGQHLAMEEGAEFDEEEEEEDEKLLSISLLLEMVARFHRKK